MCIRDRYLAPNAIMPERGGYLTPHGTLLGGLPLCAGRSGRRKCATRAGCVHAYCTLGKTLFGEAATTIKAMLIAPGCPMQQGCLTACGCMCSSGSAY
eukprot:10069-Karenia_brevis.AAC.1